MYLSSRSLAFYVLLLLGQVHVSLQGLWEFTPSGGGTLNDPRYKYTTRTKGVGPWAVTEYVIVTLESGFFNAPVTQFTISRDEIVVASLSLRSPLMEPVSPYAMIQWAWDREQGVTRRSKLKLLTFTVVRDTETLQALAEYRQQANVPTQHMLIFAGNPTYNPILHTPFLAGVSDMLAYGAWGVELNYAEAKPVSDGERMVLHMRPVQAIGPPRPAGCLGRLCGVPPKR